MKKRISLDEWRERHRQQLAHAQTLAFECAICERRIVPELRHISGQLSGRDRSVPPLCKTCEGGMGKASGYNSSRSSIPKLGHGHFMDRRIARQIAALGEALEVEANRKIWSAHYAARSSHGA